MSIYMSDAEYKVYRKKQDQILLESLKKLPVKELEERTGNMESFVSGQLEYGEFDYNDMYGPAGHVRILDIYRQALHAIKAKA